MLLVVVVFILILGLLIFVHEFGHFIMAKRAGLRVEEFGFGFPPRLFGIKKGETIYSINLLPLGGFVKIYGEDRPASKKKEKGGKKRAFYGQSIGSRAKILLAGITMNFLLAIPLLALGHFLGLPAIIGDEAPNGLKNIKVQITQVVFDSPAGQAGLMIGDTIVQLGVDGQKIGINKVKEVQQFVSEHQGEEIAVVIKRGNETLEKKIVPRVDYPDDQGPMGISLARTAIVSYPWYEAIVKGVVSTVTLTITIIVALAGLLWDLVSTGQVMGDVAGPVGIFSITSQVTKLGFIYVLQFTAVLSIHLAILNGLPFPALDGGRLLFLGIEKIKGSPINSKFERIANTAGFVILLLLMAAITWRDVVRFF